VIKQRILNIIENAKSIDQKRAVRNYGRTFEFQNMQLKPVVPNDKRPAKAKRMDNMWNQTLAKKQGVQINHLPTTPKPKVPWTMKKNPQPEKKVVDKDVDEFEKCRDTLKNGTGKPSPTVGKDIKTIEKMTSAVNKAKIKQTIAEETNESTKIEDIKETPSVIENVECKETSVITKQRIEIRDTSEEINTEKIEIDKIQVTPKMEHDVIKEAILNAENLIKEKVSLKTDTTKPSTDKEHPSESSPSFARGSKNARRDQSPEEKSISDTVPTVQEDSPKEIIVPKDIETVNPIESIVDMPKKEDKEVPSTPIVRRRGDTFTVVLPPPKCKPPPPPMFRPPPPPMSPPVPESKVKDLEKENKLIIEVKNKKPESDSESEEEEEESEWEWTEEEEESESDSECEVNKEGWENIMSSSKGPTTFKAEYSVKLGSKII